MMLFNPSRLAVFKIPFFLPQDVGKGVDLNRRQPRWLRSAASINLAAISRRWLSASSSSEGDGAKPLTRRMLQSPGPGVPSGAAPQRLLRGHFAINVTQLEEKQGTNVRRVKKSAGIKATCCSACSQVPVGLRAGEAAPKCLTHMVLIHKASWKGRHLSLPKSSLLCLRAHLPRVGQADPPGQHSSHSKLHLHSRGRRGSTRDVPQKKHHTRMEEKGQRLSQEAV